MKVYFSLLKVLMKGEDINDPNQKYKKTFYRILGVISIFGIMIPACVLIGFLTYYMTIALVDVSGSNEALMIMLQVISMFSIVFGINVICNVFYFSGDNPHLLVLPLSPQAIIGAKFTAAYFNESVMEFLVIISALIGYIAATGVNVWKVIVSIVGMVTIPIMPLAYCGIICVLVMSTTKLLKNKEQVRKLSGIITVLLILLLASSVNLLGGFDIDNYAEKLVDGKSIFAKVMDIIFPQIHLLVNAVDGSGVSFSLYILANVGCIAVFLVLAHFLYFKGVIGLSIEGTRKKEKSIQWIKEKSVRRNIVETYLKKELRILFRTPAYLTNCILVNLLWPVLAYIIIKMQSNSGSFWKLVYLYVSGNERMQIIVPLIICIISVVTTAANSIASSGITREGMQEYVMHYLPVPMRIQFRVKLLVSLIISGGFVTLYILLFSIPLHVPVIAILYYILVAWLSVYIVSCEGLYLDSENPKLYWEDELNALRGNANVFFNMAISMIIGGVVVMIVYTIYQFTTIPAFFIQMILLLILVICALSNGSRIERSAEFY